MLFSFRPIIYRRGDGGLVGGVIDFLTLELIGLSYSVTSEGGYEQAQIAFRIDKDMATWILSNWIMAHMVLIDPDGLTCFEGPVTQIEADFGAEKRTLAIGDVANRATVKYTDTAGGQQPSITVNNTQSQYLYGVKQRTFSFEKTDATDATNKANRMLAVLGYPVMVRTTEARTQGDATNTATIRLRFGGWYATLDWLTTSNTSTTSSSTTTQVATLLTAFYAVNPFLSTDQSGITASGVNRPETIAADTTYRKAIEDRLTSGDSSGSAMAWGVYDDRKFQCLPARDSTTYSGFTDYRRALNDDILYGPNGNIVPYWAVRPDTNYEVADLLTVTGTLSGDDAGRAYIARTRFELTESGMAVSLEGRNGQSIDKLMARIR